MELTIHALDWIVWIVFTILYFWIFAPREDTGLEGCGVVLIYLILTIIYCWITYFYDIEIPTINIT